MCASWTIVSTRSKDSYYVVNTRYHQVRTEKIYYTHETKTNTQTDDRSVMQYVSWWPQQAAWDSNAMNVGYWSKEAEAWYKKRLVEIHSKSKNEKGNSKLKRNADWKNSLKFGNKTIPVLEQTEVIARTTFSK